MIDSCLYFLPSLIQDVTQRSAHLEEHSVAKLDLVPEAGRGGAGVQELVAVVLLGHVGEVEVALGVNSHSGRVGCLQGAVSSLKQGNNMNSDIKFSGDKKGKKWTEDW